MRERDREIHRRRHRREKRRKLRARLSAAANDQERQMITAKILKTYPSYRTELT